MSGQLAEMHVSPGFTGEPRGLRRGRHGDDTARIGNGKCYSGGWGWGWGWGLGKTSVSVLRILLSSSVYQYSILISSTLGTPKWDAAFIGMNRHRVGWQTSRRTARV